MTDEHLQPETIWSADEVVLHDMQVSQDAADFLAFYGSTPDSIHKGLHYVFSTMPAGRQDLMKHWERVAARLGEMITSGGQRPN
jgi:hypothetical protein